MTHRALIIAGWLAMISAFVTIPLTYFSFRLDGNVDPNASAIQIFIQLDGALLFVAITLYLKRLLNTRFRFHDADKNIVLMIVANLVASVLAIVALSFAQVKETLDVAALVVVVFQGIVQIQFGFKLLKLQDDLDGMLKPFCYLNIATGICIASIVLILAGVVVSAIADLMLGTIFFHVAKLVREPQSGGPDAQP
ncbi:MAG: hypothetical protein HXX11_10935 [Desulfuromonadales bacterium]|nr:hypothetical protein [Desulfuromonadales bacterium]